MTYFHMIFSKVIIERGYRKLFIFWGYINLRSFYITLGNNKQRFEIRDFSEIKAKYCTFEVE